MKTSLTQLYVAHTLTSCSTLGPGRRGVVWVHGCTRGCPGCVAGPILGVGGDPRFVDRFSRELLLWPDIDGVTWSGGEPFEQAQGIFEVCRTLREQRDISLMAYSGFTLAELLTSPDPWVARLLGILDILVDGPFLVDQAASLLWRGSRNQRVHFLTPRHRGLAGALPDVTAGVELHVRRDGGVFWAGVPEPGFEATLRRDLGDVGIAFQRTEGVWS